jgi:hypothetical protein
MAEHISSQSELSFDHKLPLTKDLLPINDMAKFHKRAPLIQKRVARSHSLFRHKVTKSRDNNETAETPLEKSRENNEAAEASRESYKVCRPVTFLSKKIKSSYLACLLYIH